VESWRATWRRGIAPNLSTEGLESLARALEQDDPRLLQGNTTEPPPLQCVQDWPVEKACGLAWCGWQGDGLGTVIEVEEFFEEVCKRSDVALEEPAGTRWFLNWFDETTRDEMRRLLLPEVRLALAAREGGEPC
jgi:hypothetical protein